MEVHLSKTQVYLKYRTDIQAAIVQYMYIVNAQNIDS